MARVKSFIVLIAREVARMDRKMEVSMRFPIVLGFGLMAGLALIGAASVAELSLPEGPGKAQIIQACSACHAVTQVTSHRLATPQWADMVDQMVARGAQVSDDDYPIIVEYLAKNFGPTTTNTAAPVPG